MSSIDLIINTIVPILLVVGIGYLIGKKKSFDIDVIVQLIIYVGSPPLIITSIMKSNLVISDFLLIGGVAALIILIQGGIAVFFAHRSGKIGLALPATIGNCGYIGYPVALFAFGSAGLSIAVIYDLIGALFLFSIGVYLIHHKNEIKELLKLPLLPSIVIGIAFSLLNITIPKPLFTSLEMIGSITIPLALLALGYRLTQIKVHNFMTPFLISLYKILGGFFLALLFTTLFGISGMIQTVILLQASMSSAVFTMILTQKYKRSADESASVLLISTVLVLFSIPLILFLFPA